MEEAEDQAMDLEVMEEAEDQEVMALDVVMVSLVMPKGDVRRPLKLTES